MVLRTSNVAVNIPIKLMTRPKGAVRIVPVKASAQLGPAAVGRNSTNIKQFLKLKRPKRLRVKLSVPNREELFPIAPFSMELIGSSMESNRN